MSFTKTYSDQNKAMADRAAKLVEESGFFNPPPPIANQWEFADYRRPYLDNITSQMVGEFPTIPRGRIAARVSSALMRAHGRWIRNNP